MKTYCIFLGMIMFLTTAQGQVIHVPGDYPTIQQGIDAATEGDTVLVEPGTYVENINIAKTITVGSLFLTTHDESYIAQTVIDGNYNGSAILLGDWSGNYATPALSGFTIRNGSASEGGGIYCSFINPELDHMVITGNYAFNGGGITLYYSNAVLKNVTIKQNESEYGGGMYCYNSNPIFDSANRSNIFLNDAANGKDFYSTYDTEIIEIWLDTFTVITPTIVFANPLDKFIFHILNGKIQQVSADLYVSPSGDDSNSGLTPDAPLKTIRTALLVILADSLNPRTIHLANGTYSPSATGETFPLRINGYITLAGESETGVILDAEGTGGVLETYNVLSVAIRDMTITGGLTDSGGGLYCFNASPVMQNLLLKNNAASNGGAVYIGYNSFPDLSDITIINNSATIGGGVALEGAGKPVLHNVKIANNTAQYGGGIYNSSWWGGDASLPVFDSLDRCNIYLNSALSGGDIWSNNYVAVVVDTFTVLSPKSAQAYNIENLSFDILHGLLPQENLDLFVSPGGDDANSGLTADDPLKTINYAVTLINQDNLNFYTIHLGNGLYSPSSTGETFPLNFPEFTNVRGESETGVVLDAEGSSGVVDLSSSPYAELSDMTITGGQAYEGAGIKCNSKVFLKNLSIVNNIADYYGGGLYFSGSSPELENLTILNNQAGNYGGGIYFNSCSPVLKHLTIKNNHSDYYGGGIFFAYTYPAFDSINRCNIYLNSSGGGNDLYNEYDKVLVVLDTFTVLKPKSVFAYPVSNFTFDILHGLFPQENKELFVSAEGDDNNSGGTPDEPLKTIQYALSLINSDSLNIYSIDLADGIYSPSATGEVFPLALPEYVNFSGASRSGTILDAENSGTGIMISAPGVYISDLTITGGNSGMGGGLHCSSSNPALENLTITGNYATLGGGICLNSSANAALKNIMITNNQAASGGGLYCTDYSNPALQNVTIVNNSAEYGGGIYTYNSTPVFDSIERCNIFYNSASVGNDLYDEYGQDVMGVIVDTFTVLTPTAFHARPVENYHFDILNGKIIQAEADLYVSPGGDNDNSGLSASEPLKNIYAAHAKMLADSLHPHTIHLLPGTYSPSSTGELFPVNALEYISITGESENEVILDAEGISRVMNISNIDQANIANVTLTGGNDGYYGGGIYCENSSMNLENITINNCFAQYYGGGIYISYGGNQFLNHVTLSQNTSGHQGGGLYGYSSNGLTLDQVSITENSAETGGGIFFEAQSAPELSNVTIEFNTAVNGGGMFLSNEANPVLRKVDIKENIASNGGGIYFENAFPIFDNTDRCNIYLNTASQGNDLYSSYNDQPVNIVVDTFTVLYPNDFHAYQLNRFNFNILHGKLEQADADLYVSPNGNNNNSGLSADEPLKNIRYAFMKILADSLHDNTIHLAEGTYSNSANGELFPLALVDYANLEGVSQDGVILDAEGGSTVIQLINSEDNRISNMTIRGGLGSNGGGISIDQSDPILENLTISNNTAVSFGGGIYIGNSPNVELKEIRIKDNTAALGGGMSCYHSNPLLLDSEIAQNSSTGDGGGLYLDYSVPVLQHVKISGNSALNGGGIFNTTGSGPSLSDVTITNNTATQAGGGINFSSASARFDSIERCNIYFNSAVQGNDLYSNMFAKVIVDTLTVLYPKSFHAYPLERFQLDILHGKVPQIDADLFVSADGNDSNSGLTEAEPLKTIRMATVMMQEDSENPNRIHLLNGIYSTGTNGEKFPLYIPKYASIEGESENGVVIDAEGQSQVFDLIEDQVTSLINMTITGGNSERSGGALKCKNSTLDLANVTIRNNISAMHGGAIYFDNSGGSWEDVTIDSNIANFNGGGICVIHNTPVFMHNVIITGNAAVQSGGGAYFGSNSGSVLDSALIFHNTTENSGGGIYCFSSHPFIKNSVISGNAALVRGGGLGSYGSDPVLQNVMMTGNNAEEGGAIYLTGAETSFTGLLITGNVASAKGGAMFSTSSEVDFINVTMADNEAVDGGAVYCYNSLLGFRNSILWNLSDYEIYLKATYDSSFIYFDHSNVRGGEDGMMLNDNGTATWQEGNINEDPVFSGSGFLPYMLMADSPCKNAGSPDTTGLNLPVNDLAGNPRIWEDVVDMGAFEWNNVGVEESSAVSSQSSVVCYPNPTGGIVDFRISNFDGRWVSMMVYNAQGQEVAVVLEGKCSGDQVVRWDAGALPAGVYYYQLRAKGVGQVGAGKIVKY